MRLPNFFIIGAPKAGTTALYRCLQQHPEIYMSGVKEPMYFWASAELAQRGVPAEQPAPATPIIRRPRDYALLFAQAAHQTALGEASTVYLQSAATAQNLRRVLPGSRLIAILRQPAERAYSSYLFSVDKLGETAATFDDALRLEESRRAAGWYPWYLYRAGGY